MKINCQEHLDSLIEKSELISRTVNHELKPLEKSDLFFRINNSSWNIVECIEHLNLTYDYYLTEISKEINSSILKGISNKNSYKTGFMGNYMKNSMEPKSGIIKSKMKTFKRLSKMENTENSDHVFERFNQLNTEFISLIVQSRQVDLEKTKVTSLIGKLLRFKLGDCLNFLTAHNERHILQAQNILKSKIPITEKV